MGPRAPPTLHLMERGENHVSTTWPKSCIGVAVLGGTGFWLDNPSHQQVLEPSNLRVERNLAGLDAAIVVPLGARENPLFGLGPGGR